MYSSVALLCTEHDAHVLYTRKSQWFTRDIILLRKAKLIEFTKSRILSECALSLSTVAEPRTRHAAARMAPRLPCFSGHSVELDRVWAACIPFFSLSLEKNCVQYYRVNIIGSLTGVNY